MPGAAPQDGGWSSRYESTTSGRAFDDMKLVWHKKAPIETGALRKEQADAKGLFPVDFVDACEMAAAFEFGGEPDFYDFQRLGFGDGAFSEREHVAVVVRAIPDGDLFVPAETAAHAFDAIGHDGFAVARAAENDAAFKLATRDGFGGWPDEIGIIAGGVAVGAEIAYCMAFGLKHFFDAFFIFKTGVVGPDGDGECLHGENS